MTPKDWTNKGGGGAAKASQGKDVIMENTQNFPIGSPSKFTSLRLVSSWFDLTLLASTYLQTLI